MADEDDTAKTAIIFDASGAEDGAARTVAAGEKVIAVGAAMADQGTETANAAVVASSKIAAAAEDSSARTSTGYTSQINLLNRLARAYDPLASAADTASKNLGALLDIADRGGPNAARALSMISDATDVLLTKTADLDSGTKNIQDSMDRLTAKFAPAVASAKQMATEIAELNGYIRQGGEIQGSYQNTLDGIKAKYDEGAQAVLRQVEAQQQLIATAREAQNVQNSQSDFNTVLGVNPNSGAGSAAASAAVFQELDALTARFAPATSAAQKLQTEIEDLNRFLELGGEAEGGYEAALASLTLKYDENAQAAVRLAEAQQQLIEAARAAQNAQNFQDNVNLASGVNPNSAAGSAAASAVAFQEAFIAADALGKTIDALTQKFSPAATAAQAMADDIAELNAAVELGVDIEGGYQKVLDAIILRYDEGAQAAKQFADAQAQVIESARAAQNAETAQTDFNTILGVNPNSGSGTAAASAAVFQEIDGLTAKFAPAAAAAQQMQTEIDQLNRALELGTPIEAGYAAELDAIKLKYDAGTQAASQQAAALQQLIAAAREAQNAQNSQTDFNTVLGVNPNSGAGSAAASAAVFQEEFDNLAQQAKTVQDLTAKFAPLTIATAEYQAQLAKINQALELNIIDEAAAEKARETADATLKKLTSTTNSHTASTGQADFATRQLGVQTIQFFTSIETGQPIFTSFIQQFHQVIDVQVATGTSIAQLGTQLGKVFASIGSWIIGNPLISGIVAITAGIVALGAAAESTARQSETLQDQLSATRTNYAALAAEVKAAAQAVAATTNISTADARTAGQTIAAAPNFNGTQQQLQTLIVTANQLATVLGVSAAQGAEELAKALQDPGTEAEALATKHFPGMTQTLADNIKQMSNSGDVADAFNKVLAVLQTTTSHVTDAQTPLQTALSKLSDAFTKTGQDGRSFANILGSAITDAAAVAVNAIASVVSGLENLRQRAGTPTGVTGFNINVPPSPGPTGPVLQGPPVTHMVNGQMVTENAQGIMQVLPSTGAGMGYSLQQLQTPGGNIQAGLQYLQQQYLATQGNIPAALSQYGGYGTNVGAASGYISGVQNQNTANLPQSVAQAIQFWGNYYHLPPAWIQLGQQLAMQESNGQQFSGGVGTASPSDLTIPGSAGALMGSGVGGLPPAVTAASTSLQVQIDAGTVLAKSINDLDTQIADNQAKQAALQQAIAAAQQLGQPDQVAADTKALAELQGQALSLVDAQTKLKQAAEDQLAPLQAQAGFARDMATIENNAVLAARAHGQAVDQVTVALTQQAHAIDLASKFNDLVTATNQQTDAQLRINAAFDGTQDSLTHAQNAEKAYAQSILDFAPGSQEQIDKAAQYTAALDAGSAATESLQQHQQALQDLSGAFTQAFDQIGQGITNSFLQGTGAAVNWGNVMTTVAQQVLQEFLKLAVLNPLLNSLFGQKNTTLTGALGALTGGGTGPDALTGALGTAALAATANGQVSGDIPFDLPGSAGSSGAGTSTTGLLSDAGTLFSVGKALFPSLGSSGSGGGFLSSITDSIGLTGPNGLVGALSGPNSVLSGLTNLLNTSIIAPTANLAGTGASSLADLGPDAASFGDLSVGGASGATLGTLASGAGLGFGAGSLAGGFIQSSLDKTGPAPTIGAGVGALSGAAIGSIIPGIGTVIGGLIGGLLGGSGGGLIGPKPASPFSSTTVSSGLQEGATVSQLTDTSSEVATLNAQLAQISAFLAQSGLSETQPRTIQVGQNSPNGPVDNSKFSDLFTPNTSGHSAFNEESFTSQDPNVNEVISTRSFPDLQTLQTVFTATSTFVQNVASVQGFDIGKFLSTFQGVDSASLPAKFQAVSDFLTQVVPALGGLNLTTNTDLNGVANMVSQFNSLSDAFASLRFASNNSDVNEVVYGRSFSDQQDLTTVVTALNQFVTDVAGSSFNVAQYLAGLGGVANSDLPTVLAATDQFVTQTVPTLLKFNDVTGSLNDQITRITAQFATAIQTAGQLDYQEQALTATRDAAIAAAENAARHSADLQAATTNAQTLTTQASLNSGTIGGSVTASVGAVPGAVNDNVPAAEAAALATFDVQRQTQIEQLQTQYQGIFGDAYATTQDYIENSVALEASLGAQRLAIQKQYNDAIAQAEQQLGDQLRSYQGQYLTSQAQISGNPADVQSANLYNFDAQAQSQREQLVSQFQALYGDAYAQTSQYVQSSTALEASLGEQRLAIQKQYNDQLVQQQEQVANTQSTLQGQYLTAAAQISGSPTDAENAQLYNFDAQATQQRQQLVAQFEAIYGSAYASQSQYVQTSALLEKSLGEQRLAIQTQANTQILQQQEQAAQSVTSVVTSLKTYALSLQQGSASPLSLKDQYNAASAEFNSVSGAALGGDFNSLQELQTYAQALQQASQAVNGSGAGYATDIARIENVLNQVAMTPTETLTSEAFTAGLQTQTATLSGDLGDLKDLLSQMLTVLSQASRAPTTFSAAA